MEHEQLKAEAHRIALDVMSRRRAGEPLTDDDVLSQQPNELRPYLREELRKVALVQQAGALAMGGPPDPRPGDTLQRDFASDAEAEQDIRITTVEPDVDVRRTMRSTWKDTVHEEDAEDWRAAGFGSNGDAASAPIPASEEPAEEIGWDLVDEPAVEIEANSPSASREDAGFLLDDESESPLPAEAAAPESPWTDPGASIDLQPVAEGPPHVPGRRAHDAIAPRGRPDRTATALHGRLRRRSRGALSPGGSPRDSPSAGAGRSAGDRRGPPDPANQLCYRRPIG